MARPLREQFAIATFVLLVPVGAVMTFSANTVYSAQLAFIRADGETLAKTVAAHIVNVGPAGDATLDAFLASLPLTDGGRVIVVDDTRGTVHAYPSATGQLESITAKVRVRGRPWHVHVITPTAVAADRARVIYRTTIAISGVATIALFIIQAVFVRRWLPALSSLEKSAEQVGRGDLRVPDSTPMPTLELEHLRDAFRDMVQRLRTAREAIDRQMKEERRMRLEVQSLQQQVIRQERLAAIGVLVSGIAHELNNPLQTISGFSELLQHEPGATDRARGDLALIHQESARASAIIRNLSRFGRQQESTPAPVNLSDVLGSVIELRQRKFSEQGIRLERDERVVRPAHAVFTELQQVVLNFVINAEQSLRARAPDARRICLRTYEEGDRVHLEVEDSGPGVSPENETKLFQPFFTTKPVGEGTGLGLSVSYGIIHSLGGEIGYRHGVPDGAVFFFWVPVSRSEDA
ncbi:MAG TPA: ATP-binding protein [Vicinamibacterales bacterium]|nr:ATP-binding protein [Vicinamibacterales bacterium]